MFRKKSIAAAALITAFVFLLSACGGQGEGETPIVIPENTEYFAAFYAEDFSRDVWGSLSGEDWVVSRVPSSGYTDETVAKTENFVLEKGYYRFTLSASIDDHVFSSADNYPENDMVLLYRIVDGATDAEIVCKEVYRQQFDATDVLQDFSVTFASAKNVSAYAEVRYASTSTVALRSLTLQGIKASEHVKTDYASYFAESAADKSVTYDKNALYYFDLYEYLLPADDSVWSYDVCALLFTLQGLVNRDGERLFIRFNAPNGKQYSQDDFWLSYLREDGNFLSGKTVVTVERPATLLRLFESFYDGFVLWDGEVPATVNAAFTACGVENRLPLRCNAKEQSLYSILSASEGFRVEINLNEKFRDASGKVWETERDSTGSSKNDAYIWAYEKYMKTGKTSKEIIAYHLDAFSWDKSGISSSYYNLQQLMLANKDYYIANKCFFFDLMPMEEYIPNDDPSQPAGTDYGTLVTLLETQNRLAGGELFTLGGFPPWWIKYSSAADPANLPSPVTGEWSLVQMLGTYYGVKDADAYGYTSLANASIYSKTPQPEKYEQVQDNASETVAERAAQYIDENGKVKANNYIMVYMGDYDAGAWLAMAMGNSFNDVMRGEIPLCWPINPTGLSRVPMVANYMYERQTENDYFVGDHNGYGYIELMNIGGDPSLNGSLESYAAVTAKAWEKYDLDIMGFVINTTGVQYTPAVLKFVSDMSPAGVVTNMANVPQSGLQVTNSAGKTVMWINQLDLPVGGSAIDYVDYLNNYLSVPQAARFTTVRPILASPTQMYEVFRRIRDPEDPRYREGYNIEVVDPYVYFYLMERNMEA